MVEFQTIFIRKNSSCVEIVLNRPEVHNALNELMIAELTTVIKQCDQDPAVRFIKLYGEGKSFCAGADVNWMRQMAGYTFDQNVADARKLADLLYAIYHVSKPTIAYVKGSIFGGGVGIAAACDIVIAQQDAIFSLSEVKLGVIPAVISPYILQAMVGRQAKRYALTGERFNAEEAYRIGLVHYIATDMQTQDYLETIEKSLLLGSPTAQQHIKELFNQVISLPVDPKTSEMTAEAIAKARSSLDGIEGLQAFLEKRKPSWVKTDDK